MNVLNMAHGDAEQGIAMRFDPKPASRRFRREEDAQTKEGLTAVSDNPR
jgi:hypothetical protein